MNIVGLEELIKLAYDNELINLIGVNKYESNIKRIRNEI